MKKHLRFTIYDLRFLKFVRRNLFVVIFVFTSAILHLTSYISFSQPYWNEWIKFSQQYYKIPVVQNGIYRLDYTTLATAQINISNIDLRNFQVFFRGQEEYIYVGDQNGNNVFEPGDYIEFYGKKNDGSLDSTLYKGDLYKNPVRQPNPYYSLFNDTSMYFLTWNNSTNNHRITLSSDTIYTPPQTNYFLKENIIENHTAYYYGKSTITNINFPEYHEVEGWAGSDFGPSATSNILSQSVNFNTSNPSPAVPAEIKLAIMGASDDPGNGADHQIQIKYKDASNNFVTVTSTNFDGYYLFDTTFSISSLGASTDIVVSSSPCACSASRVAMPYVALKYAHNLNLENSKYYEMLVPENTSQPKSNFTFTYFDDQNAATYLYDFANHFKIPATKVGSTFKAIVSNAPSQEEKFCVVKSEKQFLNVISVSPENGTGFFTDYSTLGVDSAFIIITHKSLMSGATAYKNYRASSQGGSHNVLIADIDELYDQFAYGIPKHPFSIRHFAEYCADVFPTMPQDLFLMGKSITNEKLRNPNGPGYWGNYLTNYSTSLVPSIGYPTCDNMLVAVLNGNDLAPLIPIGRLAAKNDNDVITYLHKVNEYEHPNPDPAEWMKNVIHMGGGKDAGQQAYLCGMLHNYQTIIEDTCFGGFVHGFCKNASSPTQTSYTDSIKGLINNGVSLITFFGHSSASVFDFNLLPPDQYDNANGKYPFFTAAGCVAGDIHEPPSSGTTSSELYVLDHHGMIGVLASSGPGTPGDLDAFLIEFYKNVGHYFYGKPVGKCIQASIDTIEGNALDPLRNATCLELTLHGDPSIVIHASKLPDYAVNNTSVYFSPGYVSTDLDSFKMHIIVDNIGRATHDSVKINVKRFFADGTSSTFSGGFKHIYYKDTISFTMPVDPLRGPGLNKFEVRVDSANDVPELEDMLNNNLTGINEIPLMIYSGDIIPVYPYKYAIVPHDTIMLKAYTANPFTNTGKYIFEIDTTDLFNSPVKNTQIVSTSKGAVVKAPYNFWQKGNLILKDSTVYFWRVRRDTVDTTNFHWRESSFQYIPQKRGWGQSHFFQFLKGDRFSYIDTNRTNRSFDLDYFISSLEARTLNYTSHGFGPCPKLFINSIEVWSCSEVSVDAFVNGVPVRPHVMITIIDGITGKPWENNPPGLYGSYNVSPSPHYKFEFYTDTPSLQDSLRHFLQDVLPVGSKIILMTENNHNLGSLLGGNILTTNPALVKAFQSVGGSQFSNIKNDLPYILMGRKGGSSVEKIANALTDTVLLIDTVKIRRDAGYIYSEIIGPASKWKSLHWKYHLPSPVIEDSIKITVIGIKNNGTPDTLIKGITKNSLDIYNLDLTINASIYPNLKLLAWVKDTVQHTPSQLSYWRVYYDGVPEVALNPVKHFSFYNPVIQQGDSMKMSVAVENIGDYNMDSLWVNFWVIDANRNKVLVDSVKMDSLLIDSILIPSRKFSTTSLPAGLSSLWVEANPFNTQHQLEEYHFNNIGTLPFNLNGDRINPVLDVTFDGVHIMNGDIVSAKPSVTVKLKDENTFLALNDTGAFQVFLKRPVGNTYERIHFGSNMTFYPASLPNNSCRITYNPVLADGIYYLKVQAKDRSGNASGYTEYVISFEVINKPTVTNVLNYPNPFSTSTKFVFTLTGSEVPDYFKIQIITITGKIVRELNKYELGPLHIGRNITEYAWDGKDEFGDQLANGLYLYRVITQLGGKALEHRDTNSDSYFTQGYGKIYLIR